MIEPIVSKQNFIKRAEGVFVSNMIQYDDEGNVIKVLGGEKDIIISSEWPMTIFRYIPFSRLFTEIKEKTLTFISPQLWEDPFESAFFDLNNQYDVKCLCFTYNGSIGEEWAWKAFKNKEQIVRIEILFDKLVKELSKAANTNKGGWKFYITVCDYTMDKNILVSYYKNAKKLKQPLSLEGYLNLLSIKRKAFANEREIRIFAVSNSNNTESVKTFKKISHKNFMSRVMLEPLSPFPDKLRKKYYSQLQEIHNKGIRIFLEKWGIKLQQSHLYETK